MNNTHHPIWSDTELVEHSLATGLPVRSLLNRATGRTTACAMSYIAEAMRNPRKHILCEDHTQLVNMRTEVVCVARKIVETLGLRGFSFTGCTIYYKWG